MEIVTLFQCHHPKTDTGWITTDVDLCCAEEIVNPAELCFAYHMPNVFYFAEGGWGHHMRELGNRPQIPDGVSVHIRFEDFDHTMIFNGQYRFIDIIDMFVRSGYIEKAGNYVRVIPIGCADEAYSIPVTDPLLSMRLSDFGNALAQYHAKYIPAEHIKHIYHEIFEIC